MNPPRLTGLPAVIGSVFILLGYPGSAPGAENPVQDAGCAPDEIDLGDYCAKPPQKHPGEKIITRFPTKSLMPGHVKAESIERPQPVTAVSTEPRKAAVDTLPSFDLTHAWGIQLAAFSDREVATIEARRLGQSHGPVLLARTKRGEQAFWACLLGPYPDPEAARAVLQELAPGPDTRDAWVRPLSGVELAQPMTAGEMINEE